MNGHGKGKKQRRDISKPMGFGSLSRAMAFALRRIKI